MWEFLKIQSGRQTTWNVTLGEIAWKTNANATRTVTRQEANCRQGNGAKTTQYRWDTCAIVLESPDLGRVWYTERGKGTTFQLCQHNNRTLVIIRNQPSLSG